MAKQPPGAAGFSHPAPAPTAGIEDRNRMSAQLSAATDDLVVARARIAELEHLLADAGAQLATTGAAAALRFDFPLLPADKAIPLSGGRSSHFSFWEGAIGNTRRVRLVSLQQGLYRSGAKMAEGTPVHELCHVVPWLLDHMRLAGEV